MPRRKNEHRSGGRVLSQQEPEDLLCLGLRNGDLSKTLNRLEEEYPTIYNKTTVYASISDSDSMGSTEPKKDSAIFTTYDSSKGLERKIEICFRTYARAFYSVRKLRCCDGNEERNTLEYKR